MRAALLVLAVLTSPPAPQPADYQQCVTMHNGPIERPDRYNDHPFGRKPDNA